MLSILQDMREGKREYAEMWEQTGLPSRGVQRVQRVQRMEVSGVNGALLHICESDYTRNLAKQVYYPTTRKTGVVPFLEVPIMKVGPFF